MPGNFHDVPKSVKEQWPTPHYEHPRVKRDWLPILSCTLLGFSTVLVAGRLFLRARKVAGVLGVDDFFIAFGWLVSVGFSTVAVIDSEWYGLNVHVSERRRTLSRIVEHITDGCADMGRSTSQICGSGIDGFYCPDIIHLQHMRDQSIGTVVLPAHG